MIPATERVAGAVNPARRSFLAFGILAAAGSALAACATSTATEDASAAEDTPSDTDIGFFKDMALHHEQALAMCQRVIGRDNGDSVQALAADILQNQSFERGVMHTWLTVWGESTAPPETVMAWMGMEMPAADMTGLATDEQMTSLSTTTGMAQGRLFLNLMRAHHVGGVHMAAYANEHAAVSTVRATAERMQVIQTYEIGIIDQLLSTTYL
ncbi:DUF305 domain-containing protein [Salinibacterium sp. UTAS2018]|uniref:DUF305 domain-containing protein n=1 Tax=Salinibacterium sp. UTAS2018 TaxID=2508880 RepID=UPI00100942D4|nr:DUF305 domain-containing protein [Salinibacterium sp. UTAS2018]QAV69358.1 DUF305 domain-containing protein [Salinibacterium sp. UTAS2018]